MAWSQSFSASAPIREEWKFSNGQFDSSASPFLLEDNDNTPESYRKKASKADIVRTSAIVLTEPLLILFNPCKRQHQ